MARLDMVQNLKQRKPTSIGIDVGATNCRLGVFNGAQLLSETRFQADFKLIFRHQPPQAAWQHILTILSEAINAALVQHPDVQSIGMGFPGFIHPETQCIAQSPNLPGLKNMNLSRDLSQLIQRRVVVENDALVAAYGEYYLNAQPKAGLIYIGLGTGVGGGLIVSGKPFAGSHGVAMEIGHLIVEPDGRLCGCGNHGCLEQYASATGVSNSYFLATNRRLNAVEIAKLAIEHDAQAQAAFNLAGDKLGQALAHMQKIVDVPNVVIGGGLSASWHLMQAAFDARLNADLIAVLRNKVTVTVSKADDIAGMLGAAMLSD